MLTPIRTCCYAQTLQDPYYNIKTSQIIAPTLKLHFQTRSHATTRYKGKEIAKPITPPSESASEEDSDPEQAQRDKDMQKKFGSHCKLITDEAIDEQSWKTLQLWQDSEVPNADSGTDSKPLEQVQYDTDDNVSANDIQHFEQSESISNTCVVETGDSNVIPDSPDMCDNDIQDDQNDVECDDERVALANLIANLKLDVDENKKIQKQLKEMQCTLDSRVTECKFFLGILSRTLGESNSIRDSCLVALQNKQTEFERYKAFNDRTVDYDKLEHKLNEALGLLAQKEIDIKEGLKVKAYEISIVKEKLMMVVKESFNQVTYEGLVRSGKQSAISLENPNSQAKKSVATPLKKTVASANPLSQFQELIRILFKILIVQLILFIVDSGCTKHMTGNLSLLCNFVEKYLGTVHFGNDQFAPILGYMELVQGNITINRVYYVEGLNHNLFSVGQFCDADLEVAFQKSTCFVRDLQGNDLLTGNRGTDLYTISLQETTSSTPICLMAKASPTQAWLWHRRLSHLNFDYINLLSKKDVVIGLPKLKNLQAPVISVRTDRGTEFLNKTLHAFFKEEGIEHQTSTPRTPEQNGVVERRNRTLVEAARTMLSASKLPLFFWAEAIATACYTQNRSIIIPTHEKTAYHIINDRKPSIKHLHIFGCTCYLTRDGENLDKMKEKGDPCILVGYSTQSKGYRVYNKRTRLIVESIHLRFDEIKEMSETSVANDTSGLVPQRQKVSDYDNPDPAPELQNVSPSADTTVPSQQELDLLFGPLYDEFFNDGTSRVNKSSSPTDNSAPQDTHPSMNIHPTSEPNN
ncbi:retrovirus-related pol polyprotein from transposon TNT 1-94 [Tanacetum coccineum]|uniref:Retrovirus-related pol polyprotein from transposon TNT 1-94 n=1 Tax=Tanacetum coccineum TaxID=301880 RepID=A0ABQ4ZRD2_9ASTR